MLVNFSWLLGLGLLGAAGTVHAVQLSKHARRFHIDKDSIFISAQLIEEHLDRQYSISNMEELNDII
jgi:predicted outer membrane lipoprotein